MAGQESEWKFFRASTAPDTISTISNANEFGRNPSGDLGLARQRTRPVGRRGSNAPGDRRTPPDVESDRRGPLPRDSARRLGHHGHAAVRDAGGPPRPERP